MTSLISFNAVAIVVALLIGVIVGWWLFKRGRAGASTPGTAAKPDVAPRAAARSEGRGLASEDAAAVADVAGEFLGVDVHRELPGASGPPDNLQTLKGVGAKFAAKLNDNGIIRFDQLACLDSNQTAMLDARMEQFKGRIARDRLIEQAGYLARGDIDGFQSRFGNLGSGS